MFLRLINQIEEAIISLLLVGITLLVFFEVILRFVFNTGLTWGQEATLYLSAWFVLFGASYGLKVGAHIGVDAFVKLFSPLGQRLISTLAIVLSLVYCGLFIQGAWVYLSKMRRIGIELEDIPIQTWVAQSILLIGLVMLSIRLLGLLWSVATGQTTGFMRIDEAKESMRLVDEIEREEAGR